MPLTSDAALSPIKNLLGIPRIGIVYVSDAKAGRRIEEQNVLPKASEAAASAAFTRAVKGKEITSEWHSVDGHDDDVLTIHARYADLTSSGKAIPSHPGRCYRPICPRAWRLPPVEVPSSSYIGAGKVPGSQRDAMFEREPESARAASKHCPC